MDLVKSLETLSTNTILLLVKEVVKRPNQIKGEQVHRTHTMLTLPPWILQQFFKQSSTFSFKAEVQPGRHPHAAVQLRLYSKVRGKIQIVPLHFNETFTK